MLRIVSHGQRLVLLRSGHVVAVKGPGLVLFLPGVQHAVRVRLQPVRLDLFWVQAGSSDGVQVTVNASLLLSVEDPAAYTRLPEGPEDTLRAIAEAELRRYIAESDLVTLSRATEDDHQRLAEEMTAQTRQWGVGMDFLELTNMHIQLDPSLVRWAENQPRAAAVEAYITSTDPTGPMGGKATMDVTRTTVPGTGTVHHYVTRGGQQFGVLLDRTDRHRLLVYGSADFDVPAQTIVLEQDEADQLAELLHSKPIVDRVADLERRFSELAERAS